MFNSYSAATAKSADPIDEVINYAGTKQTSNWKERKPMVLHRARENREKSFGK